MSRPPRFDATRLLPWLEGAAAVATVAVSAPLWGGCFGGDGFVAPVAAAPVAGALAVLLGKGSWWRPLAAGLVICVGYLLGAVGWPTFADWHPTAATWTALRDGVIGGWLRLLTQAVPLDTSPTLLVTPVLITFWAGWGAVFLTRRGRRPAAPVLPGLAAYLLGLLFGATLLHPSLPLTAAFLTAAGVLILVRGNRFADGGVHISRRAAQAVGLDLAAAQRRSLFGRLAFGVPTVAFVVVAGTLGAQYLPLATGAHRFDLRTEIAPPVVVQQALTPLATLQQQLLAPAVPLFTVSGLPAGVDRIRIAALDSFDGATWTADPSETYPAAGHRLADGGVPATGTQVTVRITVSGLAGPFLPELGTPTAVDVSGLGYNPVSQSLVAPAGRTGALSYSLTTILAPTALQDGPVGAPTSGPSDTYLPQAPQWLIARATQVTAGAGNALQAAARLGAYLKKLPYAVEVPPGHGYARIRQLVETGTPGQADGFAEQHASAFVAMARALGIPARVAVGYLVSGRPNAAGSITVTSHDAHAWAEIPVPGHGWVAFETIDPTQATVPPPPDTPKPQDPLKVVPANPGTGAGAGGLETGDGPGPGSGVLVRSLQLGGLVVAALVGLPVFLVLGEKRRRRWRRRRRSSPAGRIVGAWLEVRDRLIEAGLHLPGSATPIEAADAAVTALGEPARAAADLAPLVTRAVYAADEPDPAQVTWAWAAATRLRRDLAGARTWWRRPLTWLDPRPLTTWRPTWRRLRRRIRWAG